jgi:hypothetical protein
MFKNSIIKNCLKIKNYKIINYHLTTLKISSNVVSPAKAFKIPS